MFENPFSVLVDGLQRKRTRKRKRWVWRWVCEGRTFRDFPRKLKTFLLWFISPPICKVWTFFLLRAGHSVTWPQINLRRQAIQWSFWQVLENFDLPLRRWSFKERYLLYKTYINSLIRLWFLMFSFFLVFREWEFRYWEVFRHVEAKEEEVSWEGIFLWLSCS